MDSITRMAKYLKAKTTADRWALLSKPRRRYARHLVEDYGYAVAIAIQTAYIFGYQAWQYDYRAGGALVREGRTAASFGF